MMQDPSAKHMVWALPPGARAEMGFGYSSLPEAQMEAENLKRMGYKVVRIGPITLPKPNFSVAKSSNRKMTGRVRSRP
jgi:hypothetical protein